MTKIVAGRDPTTRNYIAFVVDTKADIGNKSRASSQFRSKPGGIDAQAGQRLFPQILESLAPGMYSPRIVEDQRTARLVELKAPYRTVVVGEDMRVGKMSQVVG